MENTTNLMLAQFAAGLVHFADYKRCKVIGDLLGVYDPTRGPLLDHRAAFFLYRLLAELRTVSFTITEPQNPVVKEDNGGEGLECGSTGSQHDAP